MINIIYLAVLHALMTCNLLRRNIGISNESLPSIRNYIFFKEKSHPNRIKLVYLGWPTPSSGIKDSDHLVLAVGGEQTS